jgi:hypothetical protein
MKRDMDLVRKLLIQLEDMPLSPGSIVTMDYDDPSLTIDGYTTDQVHYHLDLIVEAGLVDIGGRGAIGAFMFRRLTYAGHDFLDSVRDDKIWAMTKKGAAAAGGFTMDLLVALAKGLVKKEIEKRTGIKM